MICIVSACWFLLTIRSLNGAPGVSAWRSEDRTDSWVASISNIAGGVSRAVEMSAMYNKYKGTQTIDELNLRSLLFLLYIDVSIRRNTSAR